MAERALRAGLEIPLSERLHGMLLLRHGAPTRAGLAGGNGTAPGFVLNLASFHDAANGFDAPAFAEAVETAVTALTLAAPAATRLAVSVADLAGLLAMLGIEYGSGASLATARAHRRNFARPGGSRVRRAGTPVRHSGASYAGLAGAAHRHAAAGLG